MGRERTRFIIHTEKKSEKGYIKNIITITA